MSTAVVPRIGDAIVVLEPFWSNNADSVLLRQGAQGRVVLIEVYAGEVQVGMIVRVCYFLRIDF